MLGHFSDRHFCWNLGGKLSLFLKSAFGFYSASLDQHPDLGLLVPGNWLKPMPIHRTHYARFSPNIIPGSGHSQNQLEQHVSVFSPMLRSARVWERHSSVPCLEGNDKSKQSWENWNLGALRVASIYMLLKSMLVNYHRESERGIRHGHVAQWLYTAPGGRGAVPQQAGYGY